MNNRPIVFKLTYIPGLKDVVLREIAQYPSIHVISSLKDKAYVTSESSVSDIIKLHSVLNVYAVRQGENLNPGYISNHKSILGELIELALANTTQKFRTYTLSCAGSNSPEVEEIQKYITQRKSLVEAEEADMEIFIGKNDDEWEVGVRMTPRPLSVRDYRVAHMKGGLNPTIAYAINELCRLETKKSYLNIFSGSGTLLVEAGIINPQLEMAGFDIDGTHIALAVKNIKKAGLIKSVTLKRADIFVDAEVDMGTYDVIVSDLPFGMHISKGADLEALYGRFVAYSEKVLNPGGVLAVYTSEHHILQPILKQSKLRIVEILELKVSTVVGAYINPRIFICTSSV